jgi:FKBP12-rapamycin complex-associated protein
MLASAVGPNLTKLLHDQLDLMFACGLSEPLRTALTAIARHIPPLLKTIQGVLYLSFVLIYSEHCATDRLLDLLSVILSGQPYKPLGASTTLAQGSITRDLSTTQVGKLRIQVSFYISQVCLDTGEREKPRAN